MKRKKLNWKVIILVTLVLCSWPLFSVFTLGDSKILHFLPLLILTIQIIYTLRQKNRILLLITILNPVIFFAIFYSVKPVINHLKRTPTIIKCCYDRNSVPSYDIQNQTFLDYYDDDCDWSGLYYYTLNINNTFTNGLINMFGNPIKTELVDKEKDNFF